MDRGMVYKLVLRLKAPYYSPYDSKNYPITDKTSILHSYYSFLQ